MTDTSTEFVAMCDHPLVQARRHRKEGGWWAWRNDPVPQVYANCGTCHDTIMEIGTEEESEYIFIPDQRTLQEWMVDWFESCEGQWTLFETVYNAMRYYCILEDRNIHVKSMEQLWLSMYMDTVHSLQWKGGKWIKK